MTGVAPLPRQEIDDVLRRALAEDLALAGDLTSSAVVPIDHISSTRITARAGGTIAGLAPVVIATELAMFAIAVLQGWSGAKVRGWW